jgi:hypothetical protein
MARFGPFTSGRLRSPPSPVPGLLWVTPPRDCRVRTHVKLPSTSTNAATTAKITPRTSREPCEGRCHAPCGPAAGPRSPGVIAVRSGRPVPGGGIVSRGLPQLKQNRDRAGSAA